MNLTIDLPDDLGAVRKAKVLAQGVSLAGFTRQVLEEAANPAEGQKPRPKKSGYGLLGPVYRRGCPKPCATSHAKVLQEAETEPRS